MHERFAILPDMQMPFEAPRALEFFKSIVREYKIKPENILCCGDEVDQYAASLYKKSPDATYSAISELKETRERLRRWYEAFPLMKLATSNHAQRWVKRAIDAEIPSELMKAYREIIQAPDGWVWKDCWTIKAGSKPFKLVHGLGYSGANAVRQLPLDLGMSVAFGHLHAHASIAHINTASQSLWGMNCGSLIDTKAYAFEYGKDNRSKPWLGCGVIIDGGLTPILIPYERLFI